ncbi:MAG: hypothetical protein JW746_09760 [Candidatus Krumholzibacteriota bacterium]|nr:hypothetical protein [Candidatus Krumholzibacteriota bacterium]
MFKGKVILFSLLLVFATSLYAGDVDPCQSEFGVSCVGMRVSICPAGDFEPIYDGCDTGGDFLWLIARDGDGNGIQNVPWTDYWLTSCDDPADLLLCSAPFGADLLTDEDGYTEISGRIAGGGCVLTGGVYLSIQGKAVVDMPECLVETCVDVQFISPDRLASYKVDLSDFGAFGDAYNSVLGDPEYDDCVDFTGDQVVNLSDFGFFGEHYEHECF